MKWLCREEAKFQPWDWDEHRYNCYLHTDWSRRFADATIPDDDPIKQSVLDAMQRHLDALKVRGIKW